MKQLALELRRPLFWPTEAGILSPDELSSRSIEEICNTVIREGNRSIKLGSIFAVKGDEKVFPAELCVTVSGNVEKIRRLGYQMRSGVLKIVGNAGMYVGEEMCGGRISVEGNVGSWLGSKMQGGTIEVYGDAGDRVGSSYRGSRNGMKNGEIVIHGKAGVETGCWMSNGTIRVKRGVGMFPGINMCGGVILIEGDCDGRAGAGMRGGRVVICGKINDVLPSFTIEEVRSMVRVGEERIEGPFYVFRGDVGSEETGRLFVSVTRNSHLNWYERFLEPWQT